jgi:hypothetical protein
MAISFQLFFYGVFPVPSGVGVAGDIFQMLKVNLVLQNYPLPTGYVAVKCFKPSVSNKLSVLYTTHRFVPIQH